MGEAGGKTKQRYRSDYTLVKLTAVAPRTWSANSAADSLKETILEVGDRDRDRDRERERETGNVEDKRKQEKPTEESKNRRLEKGSGNAHATGETMVEDARPDDSSGPRREKTRKERKEGSWTAFGRRGVYRVAPVKLVCSHARFPKFQCTRRKGEIWTALGPGKKRSCARCANGWALARLLWEGAAQKPRVAIWPSVGAGSCRA